MLIINWGHTKKSDSLKKESLLEIFYSLILDKETALMQYRRPLGSGPSGKMCPKCASHTLHVTSTRIIPCDLSA